MGVGRVRGLELGLFVLEGKKKQEKEQKYIYHSRKSVSTCVLFCVGSLHLARGRDPSSKRAPWKKRDPLCPRSFSLDPAEQASWWSWELVWTQSPKTTA